MDGKKQFEVGTAVFFSVESEDGSFAEKEGEIREINGSEVALNGEEHTLITVHKDQPGIIAQATTVLAIGHINVSNMRVFRSAKNETAVMIVCTDSPVPNEIVHMIQNITAIESVVTLLPL